MAYVSLERTFWRQLDIEVKTKRGHKLIIIDPYFNIFTYNSNNTLVFMTLKNGFYERDHKGNLNFTTKRSF